MTGVRNKPLTAGMSADVWEDYEIKEERMRVGSEIQNTAGDRLARGIHLAHLTV